MNDRKDAEKIRFAIDKTFSNLKDDPWLAQKVLASMHKGETRMKKKLSIGLILVIVLVLAFATFAVALTINLFEQYGQKDQRLLKIASQTELVPVTSTVDGSSVVTVLNAYYDGTSLILGYAIDHPEHVDFFTPTDEQLSQMQPTDSNHFFDVVNELEAPFQEAFDTAKQKNAPIGVVKTKVSLSTNAFAGESTNLGTWNETNEYAEDQRYVGIRDFDTLPETVRNLEQISVKLPLYQSKTYIYYDGKVMYTMETTLDIAPLSFAVERTASAFELFEGKSVYEGIEISCLVKVSDVHLTATVVAKEPGLPELAEDCWYDMCLRDENGSFIEASSFEYQNDNTLLFTFDATGKPLGTLTAYFQIIEGENGTESIPIPLKKQNLNE